MIGQEEKVVGLINAVGFTCDETGIERFSQFYQVLSSNKSHPPSRYPIDLLLFRIIAFLAFPSGSIDSKEMNAAMLSPQELAKIERESISLQRYGTYDATSFGARAFLKLGRDDDAYELAKIAVSPEQGNVKWTTLVTCRCILGQVAAKRGDLEEADGHFAKALEEARTSRLPMLELLTARDWKRYLLEPEGRECGAAEAVIDGACTEMKKTREQLAPVLRAHWAGVACAV